MFHVKHNEQRIDETGPACYNRTGYFRAYKNRKTMLGGKRNA